MANASAPREEDFDSSRRLTLFDRPPPASEASATSLTRPPLLLPGEYGMLSVKRGHDDDEDNTYEMPEAGHTGYDGPAMDQK